MDIPLLCWLAGGRGAGSASNQTGSMNEQARGSRARAQARQGAQTQHCGPACFHPERPNGSSGGFRTPWAVGAPISTVNISTHAIPVAGIPSVVVANRRAPAFGLVPVGIGVHGVRRPARRRRCQQSAHMGGGIGKVPRSRMHAAPPCVAVGLTRCRCFCQGIAAGRHAAGCTGAINHCKQ